MASSTGINPPFLRIGTHQVHLRDYYCEINILSDYINQIGFFRIVPLWQSTIRRFMTLLPTVEAFPLELLLLRDSPFRFKLTVFPFFVGFLEF